MMAEFCKMSHRHASVNILLSIWDQPLSYDQLVSILGSPNCSKSPPEYTRIRSGNKPLVKTSSLFLASAPHTKPKSFT